MLKLVGVSGVVHIQQRTDFALGDHHFIVFAMRAGACREAGGVLRELPCFLGERHGAEQGFDLAGNLFVGKLSIGVRRGRACRRLEVLLILRDFWRIGRMQGACRAEHEACDEEKTRKNGVRFHVRRPRLC